MPNGEIRLDALVSTKADKERQVASVDFVDENGSRRTIEMPIDVAHFVVAHLAQTLSSEYTERKLKPHGRPMTPLPVESWQTGREPTGDVTLALSVMGNANFWFRFRPVPAHECGLILAKLAEQSAEEATRTRN